MALFDNLDRVLNKQVDRAFAQTVYIRPMRSSPNGRPSVDPERGPVEAKGILDVDGEEASINANRMAHGSRKMASQVSGHSYSLSIDSRRYPDAEHVRQGDEVTLDDMRKFTVSTVADDGYGRLSLTLTKR